MINSQYYRLYIYLQSIELILHCGSTTKKHYLPVRCYLAVKTSAKVVFFINTKH